MPAPEPFTRASTILSLELIIFQSSCHSVFSTECNQVKVKNETAKVVTLVPAKTQRLLSIWIYFSKLKPPINYKYNH